MKKNLGFDAERYASLAGFESDWRDTWWHQDTLELMARRLRLDEVEREHDAVREDLVGALLHRWPSLEDPWRRDFAPTLAEEGEAIERFLEASGDANRLRELRDELTPLAARHDDLLASLAPLENLARAEETLALAGRLRAEGGPHWLRYQRFLACERGLP